MATVPQRATLDDLMRTEGKAELIGGRIVEYMSTGYRPMEIAANIYLNLREYAKQHGLGKACTDNVGYAVPELQSGRESFSPDASFFVGQVPKNHMGFLKGPPTLAVEVRSESNSGPSAEVAMADKRAEYFEAGTPIVWDVDPKVETVAAYMASHPDHPKVWKRGDNADAEPWLPGWRMAVDDIFAEV